MVLKYHGPMREFKYPTDSTSQDHIIWPKGGTQMRRDENGNLVPAGPVSPGLAARLLTHGRHSFTTENPADINSALEHIENMEDPEPVETIAVSPPQQEQPAVPPAVTAAMNALGTNTPAVEADPNTAPSPPPPAAKLRAAKPSVE